MRYLFRYKDEWVVALTAEEVLALQTLPECTDSVLQAIREAASDLPAPED